MSWCELAEQIAFTMGDTISVGVRPAKTDWFAHCAGQEVEGPSPAAAVRALAESLRRQLASDADKADRDARQARQRAEALGASH